MDMFSITLFAFSGAVLVILTTAKIVEGKRRKTFFVLKAISRGDKRLRELKEKALHSYSQSKERTAISLKKQLPLRVRSMWNKTLIWSKDSAQKLIGDLRDSRLLKKRTDGMSEFFKNISDLEKGNGEINDVYEEKGEVITVTSVSDTHIIPASAKPQTIIRKTTARKKPASKKRKMVVVEIQ